jgi:hypothetical protein
MVPSPREVMPYVARVFTLAPSRRWIWIARATIGLEW